MLYLDFLKRLIPLMAVNTVRRLLEVTESSGRIEWSSDKSFRHNLLQVLTTLSAFLKERKIQFVKITDRKEELFYLDVNEGKYFFEIFDLSSEEFKQFLENPRNLNLIPEDRSLTLNIQKLLVEVYFFVSLERYVNGVIDKKQAIFFKESADCLSDKEVHQTVLTLAGDFSGFVESLARKKNFADGGTTAGVLGDFQKFSTTLYLLIQKKIANHPSVSPLLDMTYEQAFVDPVYALGVALLDYALSKSIEASPIDYSMPQGYITLPSGFAHATRMIGASMASAMKSVSAQLVNPSKIEDNQEEIVGIINSCYSQQVVAERAPVKFLVAKRELERSQELFNAKKSALVQVKEVFKGNDFPRVLTSALRYIAEMEKNAAADLSWIKAVDASFFGSGQPPSQDVIQAKYRVLPPMTEHRIREEGSEAISEVAQAVLDIRVPDVTIQRDQVPGQVGEEAALHADTAAPEEQLQATTPSSTESVSGKKKKGKTHQPTS